MKEKYKLIEGDGRVLSMLQEESIDCIVTDHPWLDKLSNKGGNRSFADYECFLYEQRDFNEKARVLKPGCFLAEFLPAENENNYEQLFQKPSAGCKKDQGIRKALLHEWGRGYASDDV